MTNLEHVKLWLETFKEDSKNLPEGKRYIAICNIDWLIKELESNDGKMR